MIIIGIVLSFVGLGYLCWLIFALAVNALPLFAGITAGLAAYHSNSGPIAAVAIAAIVSVIVLFAGQLAFRIATSTPIRAAMSSYPLRVGEKSWPSPARSWSRRSHGHA
jgi:hypothetical protein